MRSAARRKVNVLEMKCLRSLVGVSRMDRVRNEEVRRRAGIERELESRADQRVLRWFGHVERMDEYRMARRVVLAAVSGGRVRGWPRLGWMDGVKLALGNRGAMVEAARRSPPPPPQKKTLGLKKRVGWAKLKAQGFFTTPNYTNDEFIHYFITQSKFFVGMIIDFHMVS